ncbi:unnamed protein product [Amoebophrya sp. A120]|nr:unnamed protein product [Amoebophrya sp. A120]|eukprot:GSA120T00017229001.1
MAKNKKSKKAKSGLTIKPNNTEQPLKKTAKEKRAQATMEIQQANDNLKQKQQTGKALARDEEMTTDTPEKQLKRQVIKAIVDPLKYEIGIWGDHAPKLMLQERQKSTARTEKKYTTPNQQHTTTSTSALAKLLYPMKPTEFFEKYFEKRPLVIKRTNYHATNAGKDFYQEVCGLDYNRKVIEEELEKETGNLKYGTEITLAKFDRANQCKVIENVKDDNETATKDEVKNAIDKFGLSCQCMHPQRFSPSVAKFLAGLEDEFGCLFGSNSYITPAKNHIGFAPHFDDVEVWMLQLEGKKRWRCWTPVGSDIFARNFSSSSSSSSSASAATSSMWSSVQQEDQQKTKSSFTTEFFDTLNYSASLPRDYSRDFTVDECEKRMALRLDVVLEPGDLLYIPRGTVHFGESIDQKDSSHHLTVSTFQKHSYVDFLNELLPTALKHCAEKDFRFRQGLPVDFYRKNGSIQGGPEARLKKKLAELLDCVREKICAEDTEQETLEQGSAVTKTSDVKAGNKLVQNAVDQMGSDFVVQRLPPPVLAVEEKTANKSSQEDESKFRNPDCGFEIPEQDDTFIRFTNIAKRSIRCALDVDPATNELQCLLLFPFRNLPELHMLGEAKLAEYYQEQAELEGNENGQAEPKGSVSLEEMFFPALRKLMQVSSVDGDSTSASPWVKVSELPLEEGCDRQALCQLLNTLELLEIKDAGTVGAEEDCEDAKTAAGNKNHEVEEIVIDSDESSSCNGADGMVDDEESMSIMDDEFDLEEEDLEEEDSDVDIGED